MTKLYQVLSYKINNFTLWTPITFYQTVSKRKNSICNLVLELFEQKLDTTPPIKVNNSVETPSLNDLKNSDNTKNISYDVDVQLVAIRSYLMNEIFELKREISLLKVQEKIGKCDSSELTLTDIFKSEICIF